MKQKACGKLTCYFFTKQHYEVEVSRDLGTIVDMVLLKGKIILLLQKKAVKLISSSVSSPCSFST